MSSEIPCILAVDTAGPVVGAALEGPTGPRAWSGRVVRGAESALGEALEEILSGVDTLDLVAVSVGPGAFTSLRVGVSMALGLAMAHGCRILPLSSLALRAELSDSERVLSLLDARKGRAYGAFYEREEGGLVRIGKEVDLPPEQVVALAGTEPFEAVGEGACLWEDLIREQGGTVPEGADRNPAALAAGRAWRERDRSVEPAALRLSYLREPDAVVPRVG